MSKDEQSAIGRFNRAKQEREAAFKRGSLSDAEKSNIMALSQPGLAFWASKGYRTFHRRNCLQITGLNQLVGFPRYDQNDETELLIRVLSFGPVLEVVAPITFRQLMQNRIQKQISNTI